MRILLGILPVGLRTHFKQTLGYLLPLGYPIPTMTENELYKIVQLAHSAILENINREQDTLMRLERFGDKTVAHPRIQNRVKSPLNNIDRVKRNLDELYRLGDMCESFAEQVSEAELSAFVASVKARMDEEERALREKLTSKKDEK